MRLKNWSKTKTIPPVRHGFEVFLQRKICPFSPLGLSGPRPTSFPWRNTPGGCSVNSTRNRWFSSRVCLGSQVHVLAFAYPFLRVLSFSSPSSHLPLLYIFASKRWRIPCRRPPSQAWWVCNFRPMLVLVFWRACAARDGEEGWRKNTT